ncbi:MAG: MBL fold metallo-hydrolase [Vicinamibacterales bacterium]|nr:MBL fold metallo-hydrolase [Vicinamibacterales bacterium]
MRVTFLGTGTSHGVPMIGCTCPVCTSPDPRDRRSRPSVLLHGPDGTRVLVDTSTDLRSQALAHAVTRVDAVVYTHSHADHIFGFDELRRFNVISGRTMPVYADARTLDDLRRTFAYAFDAPDQVGGGIPQVEAREVTGPFEVGVNRFVPVPILHGTRPILGYRVGRLAYLTDCSAIPAESEALLEGLDLLVLSALRHRPHPTHFSLSQAVEVAGRIGARRTLFTHMCHDLGHESTNAVLPEGMALAWDGLSVEVG